MKFVKNCFFRVFTLQTSITRTFGHDFNDRLLDGAERSDILGCFQQAAEIRNMRHISLFPRYPALPRWNLSFFPGFSSRKEEDWHTFSLPEPSVAIFVSRHPSKNISIFLSECLEMKIETHSSGKENTFKYSSFLAEKLCYTLKSRLAYRGTASHSRTLLKLKKFSHLW
jgi:hypothetical protein